jgi:hypothetical protein
MERCVDQSENGSDLQERDDHRYPALLNHLLEKLPSDHENHGDSLYNKAETPKRSLRTTVLNLEIISICCIYSMPVVFMIPLQASLFIYQRSQTPGKKTFRKKPPYKKMESCMEL